MKTLKDLKKYETDIKKFRVNENFVVEDTIKIQGYDEDDLKDAAKDWVDVLEDGQDGTILSSDVANWIKMFFNL